MNVKVSDGPLADPMGSSPASPTADLPTPHAPPTPPSPASGSESHSSLVKEVETLAGLVRASLMEFRQQAQEDREAMATHREDWQAAQQLMEQRVADLTALHERAEEALVAHIKLIESQAQRQQ